jgi:hypothetical protein
VLVDKSFPFLWLTVGERSGNLCGAGVLALPLSRAAPAAAAQRASVPADTSVTSAGRGASKGAPGHRCPVPHRWPGGIIIEKCCGL